MPWCHDWYLDVVVEKPRSSCLTTGIVKRGGSGVATEHLHSSHFPPRLALLVQNADGREAVSLATSGLVLQFSWVTGFPVVI